MCTSSPYAGLYAATHVYKQASWYRDDVHIVSIQPPTFASTKPPGIKAHRHKYHPDAS